MVEVNKKKKWWNVAGAIPRGELQALDQEEVEDCVVAALMANDPAAQSSLQQLVRSHPEQIRGVNIVGLAAHSVLNDDPKVRTFAQQQILDILKARGKKEPELVKEVMERFRVTGAGKPSSTFKPEFAAEARSMAKQVESMFPNATPAPFRKARSALRMSP
jgi:hypothetical protein